MAQRKGTSQRVLDLMGAGLSDAEARDVARREYNNRWERNRYRSDPEYRQRRRASVAKSKKEPKVGRCYNCHGAAHETIERNVVESGKPVSKRVPYCGKC